MGDVIEAVGLLLGIVVSIVVLFLMLLGKGIKVLMAMKDDPDL